MKIFLSYRRDDAGGWTTALAAALHSRFGRKNVFIDVDHVHNFENFEQRIVTSIDRCDLVLAVIGKHWSTIHDHKTGQRRLENPQDYVRLEVARALANRLPVLPVLVDGAALPSLEELPDDLRDLLRPNFQRLSQESWEQDLQQLMRRIDVRRESRRPVLVALLSLITGILTGVLGSAIARRFLWHSAPSCECLGERAYPYCPPTYGYPMAWNSYDHQPYGASSTAHDGTGYGYPGYGYPGYGYPGYGYPGYGYRGGVGGSLL